MGETERVGDTELKTAPANEISGSFVQADPAFADSYARMSDAELLRLKGDLASLRDDAKLALLAELSRRDLDSVVQEQPTEKSLRGVGGWLAFFVLSLLLFQPLATIVSVVAEFSGINAGQQSGGVQFFGAVFDALLSIGLATFGIYAGVGLVRIKRNAVRIAKRYLICLLLYAMFALGLVILSGYAGVASDKEISAVLMPLIRTVIAVGIWHSYLTRSKRVAATYTS